MQIPPPEDPSPGGDGRLRGSTLQRPGLFNRRQKLEDYLDQGVWHAGAETKENEGDRGIGDKT